MAFAYDYLLIAGLLGLFAILAGRVSARFGAPVLLVFLGLGMAAGENGLGLHYDNTKLSFFICSAALAVILFDGGLRTERATLRVAGPPALSLATLGVALTSLLVALAAWGFLGLKPMEALLVGAIIASTDAAAVFFLLRQQRLVIAHRVSATLEVESGLNDPMAIFLTMTAVTLIEAGANWPSLGTVSEFILQIGGGTVIGLAGGALLVSLVNRLDLESGLYPIFVLVYVLGLFAGAQLIDASGFLAVYLAGVSLGNRRHRASQLIARFHDGLAWLAQITMFLNLGLLVTPAKLLPHFWSALGIAAFLIFIARPLAVLISLAPFRFQWRERLFLAWVGLRGAVPIYLALPALLLGLPAAERYFGIAFVTVLLSLVLQGWTVAFAARILNLALPPKAEPPQRRDVDVPVGADRDILGYTVLAASPVLKKPFAALELPEGVRILAILRAGSVVETAHLERLQPGDYVLVVADPDHILTLDRLFSPGTTQSSSISAGEFTVAGAAPLDDLGRLYGIETQPDQPGQTIGDLLSAAFDGRPAAGDRLRHGPIELIVQALDGEGRITAVGLDLDPDEHRPSLERAVGPRAARILRRGGRLVKKLGTRLVQARGNA